LVLLVVSVLVLVWALVALGRDPVQAAEDFGTVPVEVAMSSTGTSDDESFVEQGTASTDSTDSTDAGAADGGTADQATGQDASGGPDAEAATAGPATDAGLRIAPPARRPATLDEVIRAARSTADRVPVQLQVGAIDLDVPLDAVGVQDDGQMQIPEDADRAGWYRFG